MQRLLLILAGAAVGGVIALAGVAVFGGDDEGAGGSTDAFQTPDDTSDGSPVPVSVASGVVFEDLDGDGEHDDDEPGIAGARLTVAQGDGDGVVSMITSPEGRYRVEMPVERFTIYVDPDTLAFPAESTTGANEITLGVPAGFVAVNVDFGYREVVPGQAEGTIFHDLDGDGEHDDDEPGIAGVRVIADETDGDNRVTATTDADGNYTLTAPYGALGHDVTVDIDTLPFPAQLTTNRERFRLNVPPDFVAIGVDFGYREVEPSVVAGVVFDDLDADGERDDDEPGIADVDVVLTIDGEQITTGTTDADGRWEIVTPSATATVHVDTTTLPAREPGTVPALTTDPGVYALRTTAGGERSDLDFGYRWVTTRAGSGGGVADEPAPAPTVPPPTTTEPEQAECALPGVWDLREQAFLDQIAARGAAQAGQSVSIEQVSGNYLITLGADGAYSGVRDAWSFRVVAAEGALRVTVDASDSGTWSATATEISLEEPSGQATVELAIEQDGLLIPLPSGSQQTVGTDAITGSGRYTCLGDVLEITVEGVTSTFDRVG